MASTTFVNRATVIQADWLNDVDNAVYGKLSSFINVKEYGAVGDGVTDDAAAIQAAIDAAEALGGGAVKLPSGTFLVGSTILIGSGVALSGDGYATTIKAKAALDSIIIRSRAVSSSFNENIIIRNLRIDGNRTNQTPTTEVTGIKLYSVQNALIENVLLEEIEGHGIHFNNASLAVTGQRFANVVVRGVGSGPTNTYGSCFAVTDGKDVIFDSCHAYDSEKAGFRFSGENYVFNGCISIGCGNGGLVPVSADLIGMSVNGGFYSSHLPSSDWPCDGIRLVRAKRVSLNGVTCAGNSDCGVSILNGSSDISITGCFFYNNGQSAETPGALNGRSGIAIWDDAVACERIIIRGCHFWDDQGSPTQDYGIKITDNTASVSIDDCIFGTNETGPVALQSVTNSLRIGDGNIGLALPYFVIDDVAVTGTTATQTLAETTFNANEFGRRGALRFSASGTISGTAGTKRLSVVAGGSTELFTDVSGEGDWRIEGEVVATATNNVRMSATLTFGSATESIYNAMTVDTTASWAFAVKGKLNNSADTLTLRFAEMSRIR